MSGGRCAVSPFPLGVAFAWATGGLLNRKPRIFPPHTHPPPTGEKLARRQTASLAACTCRKGKVFRITCSVERRLLKTSFNESISADSIDCITLMYTKRSSSSPSKKYPLWPTRISPIRIIRREKRRRNPSLRGKQISLSPNRANQLGRSYRKRSKFEKSNFGIASGREKYRLLIKNHFYHGYLEKGNSVGGIRIVC